MNTEFPPTSYSTNIRVPSKTNIDTQLEQMTKLAKQNNEYREKIKNLEKDLQRKVKYNAI